MPSRRPGSARTSTRPCAGGPGDAVTALRNVGVPLALELSAPPEGARAFSLDTWDIVSSGSLPAISAAFTFGREDVVPLMFQEILDQVKASELAGYDRFIYYLDRHIDGNGTFEKFVDDYFGARDFYPATLYL